MLSRAHTLGTFFRNKSPYYEITFNRDKKKLIITITKTKNVFLVLAFVVRETYVGNFKYLESVAEAVRRHVSVYLYFNIDHCMLSRARTLGTFFFSGIKSLIKK